MIEHISNIHYWSLSFGGLADDLSSSRILSGAILRTTTEDHLALFSDSWNINRSPSDSLHDGILALLEQGISKARITGKKEILKHVNVACKLILENTRITSTRHFSWSRESDSATFEEVLGPDEYAEEDSRIFAAYSTSIIFKEPYVHSSDTEERIDINRLLKEFDSRSQYNTKSLIRSRASKRYNHISYMTL